MRSEADTHLQPRAARRNPAGPFCHAVHVSPFGAVGVRTAGDCVDELVFLRPRTKALDPVNALAAEACRQIGRYLDDPEFRMDLPVLEKGTIFQRRVWAAISRVGAGQTRRYGEIATELGAAPRAVGQACGSNPYPLLVPCHRVVAAGGMGGFAHSSGGYLVAIKRWLLAHESGPLPVLQSTR